MPAKVKIGSRFIGEGEPVYVIAEIGINHNGSIDTAKQLIDGAVHAGCDAVKFQKRTPELCVPRDQWNIDRDTIWGRMKYIDYRRKIEFGEREYLAINDYCNRQGIQWFASPWDIEALRFLQKFDPVMYKVASASLTDDELLRAIAQTNKPVILSTGMSTMKQIEKAAAILGGNKLMIAHSTSNYPCSLNELNLKVITAFKEKFKEIPIGYSGHETGLAPSYAAVALGASFIERHITLDRAMWGSDQAASVEIHGFEILVSHIREIEQALGDGKKTVYESELKSLARLRRFK